MKTNNKNIPFQLNEGKVDIEFLNNIYNWSIELCQQRIAWYNKKRKNKKLYSKIIRAVSIMLLNLGILCPLIQTLAEFRFSLLNIGYIALVLAGTLILYDNFYGISAGWMRFMETQLKLEKRFIEFQYDWSIVIVEDIDSPKVNAILNCLKSFSSDIESIVLKETNTWIDEFKNNINVLDKMIQTKSASNS
jgi:hypothetical protein